MAANSIKGITIEISGNSSKLVKSLDEATKAANATQSNLKKINTALKLDPGNVETLTKKQQILNTAIEATQKKLEAEKLAAEEAKKALDLGQITQSQYDAVQSGIALTEARLASLNKEAQDTAEALSDLETQAQDTAEALSNIGDGVGSSGTDSIQNLHDGTELLQKGLDAVSAAGEKAGEALSKGFQIAADAAQKAAEAVFKIGELTAEAVKATGKISYDISSQVLEAYGSYEQLVGGVEKIFGSSANVVTRNAREAFQTATLSANDYMQTVTGFSASLLQGLGGDTAAAARIADMALRDMSDNANTYGTDLNSIIAAYQGLAKGTYSMLDNLRLGYGGSQQELVRLINDSGILEERITSLDNITFDQMIEAIHEVQTNLNITGTTAREASTTVEGSINMLRASWKNLITDLGKSDIDARNAASEVAESLTTVMNNVRPVLTRLANNLPHILPVILNNVKADIPEAVRVAGLVMNSVGQAAVEAAPEIIDIIAENLPEATAIVTRLVENLANGLRENAPAIVDAAGAVLPEFANLGAEVIGIIIQAIAENAPTVARELGDALSPVLDEALGEGAGDAFKSFIEKMIESAPELAEAAGSIAKMGAALVEALPTIADVAVPVITFIAEHLPGIVATLAAIQGAGMLANIASGILSIGSALALIQGAGGFAAVFGGVSTALAGVSTAAAGAAASLSSIAAFAAPIAALGAEVALLGVEAYKTGELIAEGEELGMSASETVIGGMLEVASVATGMRQDYAQAWYDMHRAADEAELDEQAQEIFAQINSSIESSGAASTASVRDDCAIIQGYLNDLEANGQIELHARVVTEYQSVYTTLRTENSRARVDAAQREMAERYAAQGSRQMRQQAYRNSLNYTADQERAAQARQQGEAAIRAVQETANTAQEAIRAGSGGGGGGGGGGSSKKDDESALTASKAEELLTSIDDHLTKILERFGIVTEQSDYQKNVNQMIDGVLAALSNGYSDSNVEAAINELKNTMTAYGMDASTVDPNSLEQLRNIINTQSPEQAEAFNQMQSSVSAIQAVTVDYTPYFDTIANAVARIVTLKEQETNITNVYLDGNELQPLVIEAVRSYDYETGGH